MFWWRWLVSVTAGLLLFGAAMVLLPVPMQRLFNALYFGSPEGNPAFGPATGYLRFAFAVLGAVIMGWAACFLVILRGPFRRGSRDAWLAFALALAVWFVPDTAFSLWSGFWQNAVLNAGFALLFAIPLAATYRELRDT